MRKVISFPSKRRHSFQKTAKPVIVAVKNVILCTSDFRTITELITIDIFLLGHPYCVEMTTRVTARPILLLKSHWNDSRDIKRRNMRCFRPDDCSHYGTPNFWHKTRSAHGMRYIVKSSTQIPALATTIVGTFIMSVVKSPCVMKCCFFLSHSRNSLINFSMVGISTYICLTVIITDRVISVA